MTATKKAKRLSPRGKIRKLRSQLRTSVKERDNVIDGLLAAIVAGEHVFIGGPPGTAKTWLIELLNGSIEDAEYFYWLLTRFSTPEELFGPLSLRGLKADKFERVLSSKLPVANFAFLDEIFKANSAILNSLLTLINERKFHNGVSVIDCPLTMLVGASNELPQGAELEALFDRFLVRFWVGYISDRDELRDMLTNGTEGPTVKITMAELSRAQEEATSVEFSDAMLDLLLDVKDALERDGFTSSDRRWKKMIGVLKGHAYVNGDDAVTEEHFSLLADMIWREPKDRPALVKGVAKIANPLGAEAVEVLDACREVFRGIPLNKDKDEIDANAATTQIIDANTIFTESQNRLKALLKSGRKSAQVTDAITQIKRMHRATSRFAAKLQGLSL